MPVAAMRSIAQLRIPPNALAMCQTAAQDAIAALRKASQTLKEDNANISYDDLAALQRYYLINEDDPEIGPRAAEIRRLIKATKQGITNQQITVDYGHYNSAQRNTRTHVMYLGRDNFTRPNRLLRYFIHEASHMYANTDDMAGYLNNNGTYRNPGVNQQSAANNADSLACLVLALSFVALE